VETEGGEEEEGESLEELMVFESGEVCGEYICR